MKLTQCAYFGEQDKLIMAALSRQFFARNMHVIDLPYRFSSWGLDRPENTRLWFEQDRLVAWAVMQTPWWAVDAAFHQDFEEVLIPEAIAWADERACALSSSPYGRPSWSFNVFSGDQKFIHELEKAGYKNQADVGEDSWSKVFMRRTCPTPIKEFPAPAGFTVRPLAGEQEVRAYVDLHQAVFGSKNMTVEWRARTLQHPGYRPELDLVVETPDGRLGAFCICWFDETLRYGQVEPLGCHADFRRYALGRVALAQGLRRLEAVGAKEIYVETDSYRNTAFRLYESLGFQVIHDVFVYGKAFK